VVVLQEEDAVERALSDAGRLQDRHRSVLQQYRHVSFWARLADLREFPLRGRTKRPDSL